MDCKWLLVCRTGEGGRNEFQHKFQDSTPEKAVETARLLIRHHQAESVREFPFSPIVVKGELYRQFKKLDGAEFIQTTRGEPYVDPNLKITIPQD